MATPDERSSPHALDGGILRFVEAADGTQLAWHTHLAPVEEASSRTATDQSGPTDTAEGLGARATGPRPTVVLTNGLSTTENFWRHLVPALVPTHRVVHWSYRGHGKSASARSGDYRLETHADDLWRVVGAAQAAAKRPTPAVHVAFSMGVTVLLELYRRHPECVAAMVLIAGGADAPYASSRLFRIPGVREGLRRAVGVAAPWLRLASPLTRRIGASEAAYRLARRTNVIGPQAPRDDIAHFFAEVGAMDLQAYFGTISGLLGAHASDVLPAISVPVLVIAPERDVMALRADLEALHQGIPGAQWMMLPNTGHAVLLEEGETVAQRVVAFLHGLAPGPQTRG